ncbi:MAG TPA: hypothetical protein VII72_01350 [Myxococcota bacterium]
MQDLRSALDEPTVPVAIDFSPPGRALLVAFGGIAGALGMPPFEFFKLSADLDCKRIFVRDLRQAWYHEGLPGISEDLPGIARFLRARMQESRAERFVFVGNSMGGYAAILLGALAGAHAVHAISPQTFIDRWRRLLFWDRRWRREIARVHALPQARWDVFDLRGALPRLPAVPQIELHYSSQSRIDSLHARRMRGAPGVTLHPHGEGGHQVVARLRDTGALRSLLVRALESPSSARP